MFNPAIRCVSSSKLSACEDPEAQAILANSTPYFSGLTTPDDTISVDLSTDANFENRNEVPFITLSLQGGMLWDPVNNRVTVPEEGIYSVTCSAEIECPGSVRVLSAIAINGDVGDALMPPFVIPLYGLNENEYPGIGANIAQGSTANLKLSSGDQISMVHGLFTGAPGTYSLFTTRMQIVKIT